VVRVCDRPGNVVPETAPFDIDADQRVGFQNQKAVFPWSGTIPEGWASKPIPNPNGVKFVSVTGVVAGMRVVGTLKRFCVDITSVIFLGPAPPADITQGKYPNSRPTTQTDFPHSIDTNPQGEAKGRESLSKTNLPHPRKLALELSTGDKFRNLGP